MQIVQVSRSSAAQDCNVGEEGILSTMQLEPAAE